MLLDAPAKVVEPHLRDLQDFADQVFLDLLEPRGDAPARLGDEVERPQLEGLEDAAVAGPRRHRDHRRRQIDHQPAEEGEAVHDRHLEVERDHVRPMLHHLLDAVLAVDGRGDDLDAPIRLEHPREGHAVVGRVVDDERADGDGHAGIVIKVRR